jgi:hypothetical protein
MTKIKQRDPKPVLLRERERESDGKRDKIR